MHARQSINSSNSDLIQAISYNSCSAQLDVVIINHRLYVHCLTQASSNISNLLYFAQFQSTLLLFAYIICPLGMFLLLGRDLHSSSFSGHLPSFAQVTCIVQCHFNFVIFSNISVLRFKSLFRTLSLRVTPSIDPSVFLEADRQITFQDFLHRCFSYLSVIHRC